MKESETLFNVKEDMSCFEDLIACQDKCYELNQLKPSMWMQRQELIRSIVGKAGETFMISQPFYCDYGYNIEIGDGFVGNHNIIILDSEKVTFGNHVFVGPNSCFCTSGHPLDAKRRNELFGYAKPITVGDNVWIGANVVVLPGVTIGRNSVIGAGSVVNKDIPEYVLAVGNPCKVLRQIPQDL